MILHSTPTNQRSHTRQTTSVSASERERIKADAIRKILSRRDQATKQRKA